MNRHAVICPTVTVTDTHQYREQMERIAPFAALIHIDLMDGVYAPTVSPTVRQAWWPDGITADIHLMYQRPSEHLDMLVGIKPHMVIVPSDAEGDLLDFAKTLRARGIKFGVALLAEVEAESCRDVIEVADQVLIFSGQLGYHGGVADLQLLRKVADIRAISPTVEISWDGGVSDENARHLVDGGVDVLNVGGFIQNAIDPQGAYAKLVEKVGGTA